MSRTKDDVLDQDFLPLRAKILEIAAGLDRLDRAAGTPGTDERIAKLQRAIAILLDASADRAERVQLLFSREYNADWQRSYEL
jgi:hypothetical protein